MLTVRLMWAKVVPSTPSCWEQVSFPIKDADNLLTTLLTLSNNVSS